MKAIWNTLDKDWIKKQYVDLDRPIGSIASEINVSHATVKRLLANLGISVKKHRGSGPPVVYNKLADRSWVYNQRVILLRSIESIASDVGCEQSNVAYWINKHGLMGHRSINTRVKTVVPPVEMPMYAPEGMPWRHKSSLIRELSRLGSVKAMAREYGISPASIRHAMKKFGMHKPKTNMSLRGKKNPMWRGGKRSLSRKRRSMLLPSHQWKKVREYVFKRDGGCITCRSQYNLHGHHLETLANCPERALDPWNVVTLCDFCHREMHKTYSDEDCAIVCRQIQADLYNTWDFSEAICA